jgi:hypothetical protein
MPGWVGFRDAAFVSSYRSTSSGHAPNTEDFWHPAALRSHRSRTMGKHKSAAIQGQVQNPGPRGRCVRVPQGHDRTRSFPRLALLKLNSPVVGSGGLSVAQQLYNRFQTAGKSLKAGDIAIVDAAEYHYYQVCERRHSILSSPFRSSPNVTYPSLHTAWMVRPISLLFSPSLPGEPSGRVTTE